MFLFFSFSLWFQAYVQQLESSKLKLAQLEQELQKARQQVALSWLHTCLLSLEYTTFVLLFRLIEYYLQGIFISSSGDQTHAMSGNGIASVLHSSYLCGSNCLWL
jgi:transcription factor TGA